MNCIKEKKKKFSLKTTKRDKEGFFSFSFFLKAEEKTNRIKVLLTFTAVWKDNTDLFLNIQKSQEYENGKY